MKKLIVIYRYCKELGFASLLHFLWQRLIKRNTLISISVKNLPHKIIIRNQPADFAVFTQVFVNKEYDVALAHPVNSIIDCGANIGLAALYFTTKYPQASIKCIEPEKENFELLLQNTHHYKNISCLNAGVWHKNVLLQVIDKGYGSLGFQVKETREKENSLPAKDMSSIMQDWGKSNIDIVKLDIEGSEEQVILEDKSNWPQKAKTIFVEIHDNLKPGLTEKIVAKLQTDFNFHKNGEYMVFTKKINA